MPQLAHPLKLGDIDDVEAFCRSLIRAHLGAGARRNDGMSNGGAWLSSDDYEDLLCYLIEQVWEAASRFDGRGRLSGWALWIGHKRVTDWIRQRFGSSRYGQPPELVPFDARLHDAVSYDDDHDLVEQVDLDAIDAETRDAFERIVWPMAEQDENVAGFARRHALSAAHVERAQALVRAELVRQGFAPDTPEALLAGRVRELREAGLQQREIADTLDLETHTVTVLIRAWAPDLVRRNRDDRVEQPAPCC